MMQLLGTSPEVAFDRVYPFENSYLTYLVRLVGQTARHTPTLRMADVVYGFDSRIGPLPFQPEIVDGPELARRSLGVVWSAFSHCVRARTASPVRWYCEKYWGDLTPVLEAGLAPVVIDMVRDPRDLVASIRAFNADREVKLFGRGPAIDDGDHLRHLVAGMALRLEEMAAPLPVPRLTVRYEDLVTDLAGSAAQLVELLQVDLDPDAVTAALPTMARHMTSVSADASVGRWLVDLSTSDIEIIERKLAGQMTLLGYRLSSAYRK